MRYRPLVLVEPLPAESKDKIKVVCEPVCYFIVGDKKIRSRTDSDAAGGLTRVDLRFFDQYHGLIGYEDDQPNPNFFVIDTNGEFLQVVRMKLPQVSFTFEAYYPEKQLIQFAADSGRKFLYAANRPELLEL